MPCPLGVGEINEAQRAGDALCAVVVDEFVTQLKVAPFPIFYLGRAAGQGESLGTKRLPLLS